MDTPVLNVFLLATVTALATGAGALPLLFARRVPASWFGLGNALAAGLMLAASYQLVVEGLHFGPVRTLLGILGGLLFIVLSQRLLARYRDFGVGSLKGADARRAMLIVGVMTLHSFAEGVGVGVAFGGGTAFGLFITIAIAIHNVPEGLAIALSLVPKGVSVWRASLWGIASSLPQPLLAVPAFLFVKAFEPVLPFGLGVAAGAMVWMVFTELIPEALGQAKPAHVGIATLVAIIAMVGLQSILPT